MRIEIEGVKGWKMVRIDKWEPWVKNRSFKWAVVNPAREESVGYFRTLCGAREAVRRACK